MTYFQKDHVCVYEMTTMVQSAETQISKSTFQTTPADSDAACTSTSNCKPKTQHPFETGSSATTLIHLYTTCIHYDVQLYYSTILVPHIYIYINYTSHVIVLCIEKKVNVLFIIIVEKTLVVRPRTLTPPPPAPAPAPPAAVDQPPQHNDEDDEDDARS